MIHLYEFEKFNESLNIENYCQTYLKDSGFDHRILNKNIFITRGEGKPKFTYDEIKKHLRPLVTFLDRDMGVKEIILKESPSNRTSRTTRHRCTVREFMSDTNTAAKCEHLREVEIIL